MTPPAPPTSQPRWRRLASRRWTRVVVVAVVLLVAIRIALPSIVRRVAIDQADKALVGRIELDDVDLALLTGGVTLHGLRVYANEAAQRDATAAPDAAPAPEAGEGPPGFAPVFSAQRLTVGLGFLALLHKTIEVRGIELEHFAVSLDRAKDGVLVLPAPVPAEPPPQPQEPSGWGVLIQRVMLRDGQLGFRDFAVGETPQHLDVTLPTVDAANLALLITASGLEPGKMTLDAGIRDGTAHVEATIENLAGGPAVETHVVLTNLPIDEVRLYIPRVGWSALAGRLDSDVVHRFESNGAHTARGRVGLRDLAVRVADLDQPAIAWRSLGVEITGIDLVRQHAEIAGVTLEGMRVVTIPAGPEPLPVLRGLLEAAKEGTATAPAAVEASTAKPWTWAVHTVLVKGAGIEARGGDGPVEVAIDGEIGPLESKPETHSTVKVAVAPASGGTLTVAGDLTLQPIGFDGTLRVDALALPPLTRPVATAPTRLLQSGVANLDLQIAAGATPKAPPDGVRVAGTIGLGNLAVAGEDAKVFALRWKDLAIVLREAVAPGVLAAAATAAPPPTVALASVSLTRPELVATRTATGIALPAAIGGAAPAAPDTAPGSAPRAAPAAASRAASRVAPKPTPAPARAGAPASVAKPAPEIQVRIDRLGIQKMSVDVTDQTVKPFYRSSLDPVDVAATDVRWPGPFARDVKLTAKTVDGATLTMTGNVAPTDSQLVVKVDRLPLAPFNPYAAATGYSVAGGTAQLESTIKLGRGSYDTRSKLVFNKLAVGGSAGDSVFASQFGMPLSLALSLLTDMQGNIVFDLPIAGDEKGMSIGFGTIIANAVTRAILGAITSPLKLLGVVTHIGEKPESVVPPPIVFEPGRPVLAAGEDRKLDQLRTLLGAAPALTLHLRGEASAEDRRWLQEQALRAKLADESGVVGSVRHIGERGPRKVALEALNARAEGKAAEIPDEHKPWFEEQVARQEVPDAALHELAIARVKLVQADLEHQAGIAAERMTLDPTAAEDVKSRPVVAIGLGAEAARVPAGEASSSQPSPSPRPQP